MTSRDDVGPILNGIPTHLPDIDPAETQEWLDSLDAVMIMNHHVRTSSWVHDQLSGTTLHGSQGPADRDEEIFRQLGGFGRGRRGPEGHNPARGRRPR